MKLRYKEDRRAIAFIALLVGLLFLNWSGIYRTTWTYIATFPLAFIAMVICHNHIHLGLFRRRLPNNIFSHFLSFACGNPPTAIITAHNVRHHQHCDTELDFVRCSLAPFRRNWLNFIVFPLRAFIARWSEKTR